MAKVWDYKSNERGDPFAEKVKKDPGITYTNPEMAKYLISLIDFKERNYRIVTIRDMSQWLEIER